MEGLANKIQAKYVRFFEKKILNQLQGSNPIGVADTLAVGELGQGSHPFQKHIHGFRPPIIESSQIELAMQPSQ